MHFRALGNLAAAGLLAALLLSNACSSDSTDTGQSGTSTTSSSSGDGGGSSSSTSSSSSSSSASSSGTSGKIWGCAEAGEACICAATDKAHESVCTKTYKCCATVPFGADTRCQCQNNGTAKCEDDPANSVKVVPTCPPPP